MNPFSTTGLVVRGRTVVSLLPGTSAAEDGRIQPGDVITQISGREVLTENAVNTALRGPVGSTVQVNLQRSSGHRISVQLERRALVVPHDCADDGPGKNTLSYLWDNSTGRDGIMWGRDDSSFLERVPPGLQGQLREAQTQLEALMNALSQKESELGAARLQIQQLTSRVRELEYRKVNSQGDETLRAALELERKENDKLRARLALAKPPNLVESKSGSALLPVIEDTCAFLTGCRERLSMSCEDLPALFGCLQMTLTGLERASERSRSRDSGGSAAPEENLSNFIRQKKLELDSLSEEIRNVGITTNILSPSPPPRPNSPTGVSGALGSLNVLEREMNRALKMSEEVAAASRGLSVTRRMLNVQRELLSRSLSLNPTEHDLRLNSNQNSLRAMQGGVGSVPLYLGHSLERIQQLLDHIGAEQGNMRTSLQLMQDQNSLAVSGKRGGESSAETREVMDRLVTQVENMVAEHSRKCTLPTTDLRVGVSALRLAAHGSHGVRSTEGSPLSSAFLSLRKSVSECEQWQAAVVREVAELLASVGNGGPAQGLSGLVSPIPGVLAGASGLGSLTSSNPVVSDLVRSLDKRSQVLEEQLQQATRSRTQTEQQVTLLESELAKQAAHFRGERTKFMDRLRELENKGGGADSDIQPLPRGANNRSSSPGRGARGSYFWEDGEEDGSKVGTADRERRSVGRGRGSSSSSYASPRTQRYMDQLGSDDSLAAKKLELDLQALSGELQKERHLRRNLEAETILAGEKSEIEFRSLEKLEHTLQIVNEKLSAERRKSMMLDEELREEKAKASTARAQLSALQIEYRSQQQRWGEESDVTAERISKLEHWLADEQEKAAAGLLRAKKLEAELLSEREQLRAHKSRDWPKVNDLEEMLFETKESQKFAEAEFAAREAKLALERDQAHVLVAVADTQAQARVRRAETIAANLKERCLFLEKQLNASRGWHPDDTSLGRTSLGESEGDAKLSINETQFAASRAHSLETQLRASEKRIIELELLANDLRQKDEDLVAHKCESRKIEEERDAAKAEAERMRDVICDLSAQAVAILSSTGGDGTAFASVISKSSPSQQDVAGSKENIEKCIAELVAQRDELQVTISSLENRAKQAQGLVENKDTLLSESRNKIAQLSAEQATAKKHLRELEAVRDELESKLESNERALTEIRQALKEKEATVSTLKASFEANEEDAKSRERGLLDKDLALKGKQREMEERDQTIKTLQKELLERDQALRSLQGNLSEAEHSLKRLQQVSAESEQQLKKLRAENTESEGLLANAKREAAELEQKLRGSKRESKEWEDALTNLRGEMAETKVLLEKARREASEAAAVVQKREQSLSQAERDRDDFERSLKSVKENLLEKEKNLILAKQSANDWEQSMRKLERELGESEDTAKRLQRDLNARDEQLVRLQQDLDAVQMQLKSLRESQAGGGDDSQLLAESNRKVESLGMKLQAAESKIGTLQKTANELSNKCDTLEAALAEAKGSTDTSSATENAKLVLELEEANARANMLVDEYVAEKEKTEKALEQVEELKKALAGVKGEGAGGAELAEKIEEIRKLRKVLRERDDEIEERAKEPSDAALKREIESLRKQIAEGEGAGKEEEIRRLKKILGERDIEIAELDMRLVEANGRLEKSEERLALLADELVAKK